MYIKLDQKEVPYKPQIYQRGRGQNRQQFRQGNNWRGYRSFSRNCIEGNRGCGRGRSGFWRGNFWRGNIRGRYNNNNTGRNWENRRTWRNLDQEKEKGELVHHPVLDQDREPACTEIGLGVLNVENMTTL